MVELYTVSELVESDGLLVVRAASKRVGLGMLDVALELHDFERGGKAASLSLLPGEVLVILNGRQIVILRYNATGVYSIVFLLCLGSSEVVKQSKQELVL